MNQLGTRYNQNVYSLNMDDLWTVLKKKQLPYGCNYDYSAVTLSYSQVDTKVGTILQKQIKNHVNFIKKGIYGLVYLNNGRQGMGYTKLG